MVILMVLMRMKVRSKLAKGANLLVVFTLVYLPRLGESFADSKGRLHWT